MWQPQRRMCSWLHRPQPWALLVRRLRPARGPYCHLAELLRLLFSGSAHRLLRLGGAPPPMMTGLPLGRGLARGPVPPISPISLVHLRLLRWAYRGTLMTPHRWHLTMCRLLFLWTPSHQWRHPLHGKSQLPLTRPLVSASARLPGPLKWLLQGPLNHLSLPPPLLPPPLSLTLLLICKPH